MNLLDLGFNETLEKYRVGKVTAGLEVGRVAAEHKERYKVITASGEIEAEITGNLRFTAQNREDFPAVGDWVACQVYEAGSGIIHQIFPRHSAIRRQAVGHTVDTQIIAANIDFALLVQAAGYDFNINRLERYLTICNSAGVKSFVILNKTDLFSHDEVQILIDKIKARVKNIIVVPVSSLTLNGYPELDRLFEPGKTYCLLGSSGVGKSTLLNHLSGGERMKTGNISESTNKGKHVTSHRELVLLPNGSILIDNPGMREVGIADSANGVELTFEMIESFARRCRYKDCTHTGESGCAVIAAVEQGEIDQQAYENFLKMQKEQAHFNASTLEKRQKDKEFGRLMKNYKKDVKKGKY